MTDSAPGAGITLTPGFHFNEVKPLLAERLATPLSFAPPLGVLANFTGSFAGKGFNLIFRPQNGSTLTPLPKPAHGPNDNILELNLTTETLVFSASLGSVPNRGMVQGDIFLNGVPYVQTISDVTSGPAVVIHFEPGIWLAVPATTDPKEPAPTFARMASIPHGTTINLQGSASAVVNGPPTIPAFDPTPFPSGTHSPIRFPSQTASDDATFRIPQNLASHLANGSITQAILDDPNTVLRAALTGQTIVNTVTLMVESVAEVPAAVLSVPAVGGGTANIAFLTANGLVPTQQASPGKVMAGVKSTFWIETVEHDIHVPVFQAGQLPITVPSPPHPTLGLEGPKFVIHPPFPIPHPVTIKLHSTQIQYSQVVLLNFNGLTWPHVSVATLAPSSPVTPPPAVWEALRKVV